MAQLKDTTITGSLRATNSIASPIGQFDVIYAKENTSSGITENYTSGADKKILQSGTFNNEKTTYWVSLSPSVDVTIGTIDSGPKIGVTIAGDSTLLNNRTELNKATVNIYGVTKLTSDYDEDNLNLATNGRALQKALQTLDSNISNPDTDRTSINNDSSNPGVWKTLTALSIIDGKINSTTFSDIEIDSSQITSGINRNTILYGDGTGVIQSIAPEWKAWVTGTTEGPQAKIQIGNIDYTSSAIPAASETTSGVITTGNQIFSGTKTFIGEYLSIIPSGEGSGEIRLNTADDEQAGITLDVRNSKFRVYGIASADEDTITGVGTPLEIDPYNKIIDGGYTLTGHASLDLPLTGGTLTNALTVQTGGIWIQGGSNAGGNDTRMGLTSGMPDKFPYNQSKRGTYIYSNAIAFTDPYNGNSGNDSGWIRHLEETANSGVLEIAVGDDGNESIVARQYNTSSAIVRTATLLDASGNTSFPGTTTTTNLYINGGNGAGIYYAGTKATYRMIRFIDNTGDTYGNGISIGGGGYTIIGSGESADTMVANLGYTGGSEITVVASDGDIAFYPGNNSYDASAKLTMTASRFWAGVNGNTTREAQVGVQSGSGQIYMWSSASTTGNRGVYVSAHGSGGARAAITVGTNNEIYYADGYNGTSTRLAYSQAALAASAVSWLACWNGYELRAMSKTEMANATDSAHKWTRLAGDTMSGTLAIVNNTQNNGTYNALLYVGHSSNNDWGAIITKGSSCDYGLQVICKSDGSYGVSVTGRITGTKVYGAVWNDYAECRNVNENIMPGQVVYETPSKTMKLANKRLQAGCRVVSDTYGMCIGETEDAKVPIAVCGRVLVYPYRNREQYELGAAVCSAPNGTVDIMTREEIRDYPERIIGTISEIPDYEIWHAGERDGNHDIQVKGRIWIYVR